MAKRTWITVKRGILEPKHRFALGELIWLFMYILDQTNWEAGVIEEWLDRGAAEELEMPLATLVDQRHKLEIKGYITSERKQHGIRVVVHNWTNPREYTGKKYNEKSPINTPDDTLVNTPVNTPEIKNTASFIAPSFNQKSQIKRQKPLDILDHFQEITGVKYIPREIAEMRRWTNTLQFLVNSGMTDEMMKQAADEIGDDVTPDAMIPIISRMVKS